MTRKENRRRSKEKHLIAHRWQQTSNKTKNRQKPYTRRKEKKQNRGPKRKKDSEKPNNQEKPNKQPNRITNQTIEPRWEPYKPETDRKINAVLYVPTLRDGGDKKYRRNRNQITHLTESRKARQENRPVWYTARKGLQIDHSTHSHAKQPLLTETTQMLTYNNLKQ